MAKKRRKTNKIKVKIHYWEDEVVQVVIDDDGKPRQETRKDKWDTTKLLKSILNGLPSEKQLQGWDNTLLMIKVNKEWKRAVEEKDKFFFLEKEDYKIIKDNIKDDLLARIGLNEDMSKAMYQFMEEAKEVELDFEESSKKEG